MSRPFLKIPSDSNLKWISIKTLYDRIYKIDTMYDEFFNNTKFEFLLTKEKIPIVLSSIAIFPSSMDFNTFLTNLFLMYKNQYLLAFQNKKFDVIFMTDDDTMKNSAINNIINVLQKNNLPVSGSVLKICMDIIEHIETLHNKNPADLYDAMKATMSHHSSFTPTNTSISYVNNITLLFNYLKYIVDTMIVTIFQIFDSVLSEYLTSSNPNQYINPTTEITFRDYRPGVKLNVFNMIMFISQEARDAFGELTAVKKQYESYFEHINYVKNTISKIFEDTVQIINTNYNNYKYAIPTDEESEEAKYLFENIRYNIRNAFNVDYSYDMLKSLANDKNKFLRIYYFEKETKNLVSSNKYLKYVTSSLIVTEYINDLSLPYEITDLCSNQDFINNTNQTLRMKDLLTMLFNDNKDATFVLDINTSQPDWERLLKMYFYYGFVPINIQFNDIANAYLIRLLSEPKPYRVVNYNDTKHILFVQAEFAIGLIAFKTILNFTNDFKLPFHSNILYDVLQDVRYSYSWPLIKNILSKINQYCLFDVENPDDFFNCSKNYPPFKDGFIFDPSITSSLPSISNYKGLFYKIPTILSKPFGVPYFYRYIVDEQKSFYLLLLNDYSNPIFDFYKLKQGVSSIIEYIISLKYFNSFHIITYPFKNKLLTQKTIELFEDTIINSEKIIPSSEIENVFVNIRNTLPCSSLNNLMYDFLVISRYLSYEGMDINSIQKQFTITDTKNKLMEFIRTLINDQNLSYIKSCSYRAFVNPEDFLDLKQYVYKNNEWGGYFNLIKTNQVSQNTKSYAYSLELAEVAEGNEVSFNLQNSIATKGYKESKNPIAIFHTHPLSTYKSFSNIYNPFSSNDYNGLYHYKKPLIHFIISLEGVYIQQISENFQYFIKTVSEDCHNALYNLKKQVYDKELSNLVNLTIKNIDNISWLDQAIKTKISQLWNLYNYRADFIQNFIENDPDHTTIVESYIKQINKININSIQSLFPNEY